MMSLFASEEPAAKRERLGDPLQILDRAINFGALAAAIDAKLGLGRSSRGGRPPYATELMIRLLVVQQLYNLSDDALEYQLLPSQLSTFFGVGEERSCARRQDLLGVA